MLSTFIASPYPPRNHHTINLCLSATALALFFLVGLGEISGTSHHRQFDTQRLPPKKAVRMGDEGKAVGTMPPTALLSLRVRCGQYKISKIKLSISMIAVTPATESTNASLASW